MSLRLSLRSSSTMILGMKFEGSVILRYSSSHREHPSGPQVLLLGLQVFLPIF
jgi:hypothetical protein